MICAGVSDILYSGDTRGENSCSMHALIVAVHTRDHVALDANDVYIHDIYRYRFILLLQFWYTTR